MDKAKPYRISKHVVLKAFKRVKANKGAAGVDGESIAEFEKDLKNNLYKLWNRMSSGSYFPPPVLSVAIPKKDGGERILGVPTVSDRIAQAVARQALEPLVEPCFHPDSYGYRPGRSAHDALDTAKRRCWKRFWVVDLDVKGFFDNIDHDLLMRAVRHHQPPAWVVLYIERWLKAPSLKEDGTLVERTKGTPQGGVMTPRTQKVTCVISRLVWIRRRHRVRYWQRVLDPDCVSSDENLLDYQAEQLLSLYHIQRARGLTQTTEKLLQTMRQKQNRLLIHYGRRHGAELRLQLLFSLLRLRHALAQLIKSYQAFLISVQELVDPAPGPAQTTPRLPPLAAD